MELDDLPRATTAELPTLRELFKLEGDEWKKATSDGSETPEHHALDVTDSSSLEPRAMRFVLSFSNLTYSVSVRRKLNFSMLFPRPKNNRLGSPEIKTLLNDISGEARDGEILAVMGASGSGKSTLIDALANRIARGSLKGSVTLNGETIESRLLKAISAYVMQDDLLFPLLTVEETLTFAAEFRLPRALSRSNKKMRVQALIDQLDLGDAAKTVIGDEGHRGVSGGERRRVSIGIDIIHDPIILFLDEPTSGLDSTSAFTVVKVLQRIANTGSIVVMSVHQPSSRILGLIDRMIILSRGEAAFSGSPMQLSIFFSEFGHPIPENENHTEFALDLIRELEEASSTGASSLVEFNESWQSGNNIKAEHNGLSVKEAINASISRGKLVSGTTNTNKSTPISKLPTFANPIWIEIANLTHRSFINSSRTPSQFAVRLAAVLITGFILATVFWRLDNSPKGIQERLGVFSFAVSTAFYTTAQALPVFLQDRHIFLRETAHNAYRRFSYLISLILVAIPPILILSLSFATTTFWALGLDGGKSGFLFYFLILVASFWSASSFVTFLSVLIPNVILGYTIVVKTLASFFLFSGFFVNRNRIPNYWVWFHYLSLVKYPYEAVLQNEFGDTVKCFVRGIQVFDYTPLSGVSKEKKMKLLENLSETLKVNITESTCLTVGENILRRNGVTELNKWNCLWVTVGCGFLFRILFYILLLRSENKRR